MNDDKSDAGNGQQRMLSDLIQLDSIGPEILAKLADLVIDFLLSPMKTDLLLGISTLGTEYQTEVNALKVLSRGLIAFFETEVKIGQSSYSFLSLCSSLGISGIASGVLIECWETRSYKRATSVTSNVTQRLFDVELKLGITAASSCENQVGQEFIQLQLTTVNKRISDDNNVEDKYQRHTSELSLDQFHTILAQLECCRASLDCAMSSL